MSFGEQPNLVRPEESARAPLISSEPVSGSTESQVITSLPKEQAKLLGKILVGVAVGLGVGAGVTYARTGDAEEVSEFVKSTILPLILSAYGFENAPLLADALTKWLGSGYVFRYGANVAARVILGIGLFLLGNLVMQGDADPQMYEEAVKSFVATLTPPVMAATLVAHLIESIRGHLGPRDIGVVATILIGMLNATGIAVSALESGAPLESINVLAAFSMIISVMALFGAVAAGRAQRQAAAATDDRASLLPGNGLQDGAEVTYSRSYGTTVGGPPTDIPFRDRERPGVASSRGATAVSGVLLGDGGSVNNGAPGAGSKEPEPVHYAV